jgi:uncharacterized Fe-S cluster-containing protein
MTNRQYIIIKNKKGKTCVLIHSGNTKGQKYHAKGSRKETKIQQFYVQRKQMWNEKDTIIPVITGTNEIITKHSIDSVQKTAVLVTSHIMQKVLQSET